MTTKTQTAIDAYKVGAKKLAFKIASDFKLGMMGNERKILKRGYEVMVWPQTYAQMGVDVMQAIAQADQIFRLRVLRELVE